MSVIGDNIKAVRGKKNLSSKEVAKKAGITELLLSDIESGKRVPNTQLTNNISKVLGVNIDAIEPSYFSSYFENEEKKEKVEMPQPKKGFKQDEKPSKEPTSISDAFTKAIRKIPVLNKITSGKPIPFEGDIIDYKLEPAFQNKSNNIKGEDFIYHVCQDNSMSGARILKNDLCLVFLTDSIMEKDIILFAYNNKIMLRRFRSLDDKKVILYPDNSEYEAVIAEKKDLNIIGKIVRVEFKI